MKHEWKNVRVISSQEYIDEEIVAEKSAARDYTVTLGRIIDVYGVKCRVLIDGHHSLAAALADGVAPEYIIASVTDCDREGIIDLDDYLLSHWIDSDWHYVATGELVF